MHEYEAIVLASAELGELILKQPPLEEILNGIGDLAVAVIASCEEAGVTLEEKGKVAARTTTGGRAERVDSYQYGIGEGPCLHASRTRSTVLIEDMAVDDRWPRFASFAHGQGVHSSFAIPMTSGGEHFGVLNLYSMGPAFGPADAEVGSMFAREATNAVRHAATFKKTRDLIGNLHAALESRSIIGAAVGILMSRGQISRAEAFEQLAEISQRENIKLRDVAERITEHYETTAGSRSES